MAKTLTLLLMDPPFESANTTTAFRLVDAALRNFQLLHEVDRGGPELFEFLAAGEVQFAHQLRQPLPRDLVDVLVIPLDDPLLMPGVIFHSHKCGSVQCEECAFSTPDAPGSVKASHAIQASGGLTPPE